MPTVAQKRAHTSVSIAPLDLEAQPRLAPQFDAIPVAPKPQLAPVAIKRQRREMQAALVLLSVALLLVILKERAFWQQYLFPSETAIESTSPDQSFPDTAAPAIHSAAGAGAAAPRSKAKLHVETPVTPAIATPASGPSPTPYSAAGPVMTAATRAVLPPLEIEVVAGDQHRNVQAGSNSVKVNLQTPAVTSAPAVDNKPSAPPNREVAVATNTSGHVQLSPQASQVVSHPVQPDYPLLARQMKVQGAVVLQALIGKTGVIQDLKVVSGPAILSAAAREAVTQWHFKPYFENGQPVETQARITVNFTISTN